MSLLQERGPQRNWIAHQSQPTHVTGTIPSEVGVLDKLTVLAVEAGHITGSICSKIGVLANLAHSVGPYHPSCAISCCDGIRI